MRTWLAVVALLVATACSSSSGGIGSVVDHPGTATPAQTQAYGYGAQTSGVDYQDDVVVVGGGPAGIRGASADGLTWRIDASAPGATRLRVGSVMLMTSVAAGRVEAIHDEGATRVVTLAPVQLTDVLRNGKIDLHQTLDSKAFRYQPVPGLAVGAMQPEQGDLPEPGHSFRGSAVGGGQLPPLAAVAGTIGVPPWKIKPFFDTNGKVGVDVERESDSGLKLTAQLAFLTHHLSIDGGLSIIGGATTKSSLRIDGLTGLQISFGAGVKNGGDDNGKATIILPGEFKYSLPPTPATGEVPITITVKYKLSIATALTGKNSTLLGTGKYKLAGPLGFDQDKAFAPTLSTEQSLIDSLSGITLGPSGVVVALNFKVQVGIGTPLLNAGPNAGVTVAVGATNGSSLGAPLARCRGASLDIDVTFGASVNIEAALVSVLTKILKPKQKLEFGDEAKVKVLHRAQVVPDTPLCRG